MSVSMRPQGMHGASLHYHRTKSDRMKGGSHMYSIVGGFCVSIFLFYILFQSIGTQKVHKVNMNIKRYAPFICLRYMRVVLNTLFPSVDSTC